MSRRVLLSSIVALGLAQLAPSCETARIEILAPASHTVDTFGFDVSFRLTGDFVPGSEYASLNFVPLVLVEGDPGEFTAMVGPGAPLADENVLIVKATRQSDGERLTSGWTFAYAPPKARVYEIEDEDDLITGPLAHNRLGDYMLENEVARFVVQDVGQRDLYSVGAFGGNLIDAERVGTPGLDNFLEFQPMINIETVLNAQTVEIVNDGGDGTAAQLRVCGKDDLLDFVNPSSQVRDINVSFPEGTDDTDLLVTACTTYSLEPGKAYVRVDTELFNNEPEDKSFYIGDWINGGGDLDQWNNPGSGLGAGLFGNSFALSYIGTQEAAGVDYAYVSIPVQKMSVPGIENSTFFSVSGVTIILNNLGIADAILGAPARFDVPSGGSNTYTRYFAVGDGSGANATGLLQEVTNRFQGVVEGCVTVGGEPAAGARITLGGTLLGELPRVTSTFTAGLDGCYRGASILGPAQIAASLAGAPYEGGGSDPLLHDVVVSLGTLVVDFALPATGRLQVDVVDEAGAPLPSRVSVVGYDPSPEPITPPESFLGFSGSAIGLFNDPGDAVPFGVTRFAYTDASGSAELRVEPGTYYVYVTRGTEYSLYSEAVTITAGATTEVDAQIARVLDTPGFISSDYHVHGIRSADSRVNDTNRVLQFGGEGVENPIMTDHHVHTDLNPRIAEMGMGSFITSTIGEEITTFDYGHFNSYPRTVDDTLPSGGSTDWAVEAPPGADFPVVGPDTPVPSYQLPPQGILDLATSDATSTPNTVVQINHIGSHFGPMKIDTSQVPPEDGLTADDRLALRLDPAPGNLFAHFPALELWNGSSRGAQSEFLGGRIGVWFNHLNQGLLTTAIADTDTHNFFNLRTAGARTWTASPTDLPAEIDPADVADAVQAGKAVGGQGIYVQTRLLAQDGSNGVADLTLAGSTLVASSNGDVNLEISVQAPLWAAYDTIEIYANAATTPDASGYQFGAVPTMTMTAGVDFDVSTQVVDEEVEGASRLQTLQYVVPFTGLAEDTWFVVVVKGTDGVSEPMFPAYPSSLSPASNEPEEGLDPAKLVDGNLGEAGVLALGFTNALYADVDGEPGFHPPWTGE